jgi:hypothetical protein
MAVAVSSFSATAKVTAIGLSMVENLRVTPVYSHWLMQAHLDMANAILKAAGGNDQRAAQIYAAAQSAGFAGREDLAARLIASVSEPLQPGQWRQLAADLAASVARGGGQAPDPRAGRPEAQVEFLMETSLGEVSAVDAPPPLDASAAGYVITVLSLPGEPTRIALRAGYGATVNGAPAPFAADQRKYPHIGMQELFFPPAGGYEPGGGRLPSKTFVDEDGEMQEWRAAQAGAYFEFNPNGSLTLTTKSAFHNARVERVGTLRFAVMSVGDNAARTLQHNGGAAVRELAQLLADKTGRSIVLGDPEQAWTGEVVSPKLQR